MAEPPLHDCHVLVVEDEYLLAEDLQHALTRAGATVLGPVPDVAEALALIAAGARIDMAVLDLNLRGDIAFPVADALLARGVPFALSTGYDERWLPARFAAVPRLEKPFKVERLAERLAPLRSAG